MRLAETVLCQQYQGALWLAYATFLRYQRLLQAFATIPCYQPLLPAFATSICYQLPLPAYATCLWYLHMLLDPRYASTFASPHSSLVRINMYTKARLAYIQWPISSAHSVTRLGGCWLGDASAG